MDFILFDLHRQRYNKRVLTFVYHCNRFLMNKYFLIILLFAFCHGLLFSQPGRNLPIITAAGKGKVNTKIDNIGYWSRMVKLGYVKPSVVGAIPPADSTTSMIFAPGIKPQNSPDVPVTNRTDVTQSENSVFIDPESEEVVLNSNNSSNWVLGYADTPYGADELNSSDFGQTWDGYTTGIPLSNSGDPCTAIGTNGWWYIAKIRSDGGQGVAYSKDQGKTWKEVIVAPGPTTTFGLLDKNHLWIDNSLSSPHHGNLYCAWTNFIQGNADTNQVELSRSTDQGLTWSSPLNISQGVAALKLNHGVNLQTGPNGEVYAVWSIYDNWPADETAIGFSKSIDGGTMFTPATRIISNIKGIRMSGTGKNMRVSSFPCMTVDNSTGPNRGTIYIVWSNIGVPGVNTGSDISLFMIRSTNQGESWSVPSKINQDPPGYGKQHYLPWITCDPVTGGLCVVYYDDRNLPATEAETYVSYSYDGGMSWTDMKISDFSFTPEPIAGLAYNYFGDYLGIQSRNMKVYPTWTDNHYQSRAMTYVSPFDLGPNPGQPWVVYYSNELSQIPTGTPQNLNFGDSLHLSLGLRNIGDQPVSGVTAYLSCTSPYITMTDSVEFYGTLDSSQVKVIQNGYAFKVSDTIPDNLKIRFNIRAAGPDSTWYSHFTVQAHAPGLLITNLVILDTVIGNRNGWLDPGETARLRLGTSNTGDFPCPDTYGILSVNSPYLTLQNDSVFMDTIITPHVKYAYFTVVVSPDAPIGTGVNLQYDVFSGNYHIKKKFHQVIGQVTEDWETNTFTKFPWQLNGSLPWTITNLNPFQGLYSAQSGRIYDNENSTLSLTYTAAADDSISFYYKTSTEQDYDFLTFTIDNVLQDQWSGENPWTRASYPVSAGMHLFRWRYQKDLAYAAGQDRVWLDFIAFPAPLLPEVNAGPDDTACSGSHYILHATASLYDSIRWSTAGDGLFSNDTLLSPVYNPGSNDIINGYVNLKLTGWNTYGSYFDRMKLTLAPIPVASISLLPNDSVCAGQSITLMADTTGIASYSWFPGNLKQPVVTADTSGHGIGTWKMVLTTWNPAHCMNRDSVYLTFRDCTGINPSIASHGFKIIPNPTNGNFFLQIGTPLPETIGIAIHNSNNELVFQEKDVPVNNQYNKYFTLQNLPDGVYLLTITRSTETLTRKLIISK